MIAKCFHRLNLAPRRLLRVSITQPLVAQGRVVDATAVIVRLYLRVATLRLAHLIHSSRVRQGLRSLLFQRRQLLGLVLPMRRQGALRVDGRDLRLNVARGVRGNNRLRLNHSLGLRPLGGVQPPQPCRRLKRHAIRHSLVHRPLGRQRVDILATLETVVIRSVAFERRRGGPAVGAALTEARRLQVTDIALLRPQQIAMVFEILRYEAGAAPESNLVVQALAFGSAADLSLLAREVKSDSLVG